MRLIESCLVALILTCGTLMPARVHGQIILGDTQKISDSDGDFGGELEPFDRFGMSTCWLGDLDGDGESVAAIAVGNITDDDGSSTSDLDYGAVWILFLNEDGTVSTEQKIGRSEGGFDDDATTGALNVGDSFGKSVAWLGDLDGDGDSVAAMAVGTPTAEYGPGPFDENHGAVWILFLNDDGTVDSKRDIADAEVGGGTLDNFDSFGASVSFLEDLDGDGDAVAALAVGSRFDDDGGFNRGSVYVLFLNDDGTVDSRQKISDTEGDFTGALSNSDSFGSSVCWLGDLDGEGDSVGAIAVGAPFDDDNDSGAPGLNLDLGAVWILFLNDDGTVDSHQKISDVEGEFPGDLSPGDEFGSSVANLGDIDGNGTLELAVGALGDDSVWILSLNEDGTVYSDLKIKDGESRFPEETTGRFGQSVCWVEGLGSDAATRGALAIGADGDNRGAVWIQFLDDLTSCSAPDVEIPDGDAAGVSDELNVDRAFSIDAVTASVDVTHPYNGDLQMTLTSPAGTEVVLLEEDAARGEEDVVVIWDDDGLDHSEEPLSCACSMAAAGELEDFYGESSEGDWTLFVADGEATNEGTLDAWCLRLLAQCASAPADFVCEITEDDVSLTWTNVGEYALLSIERNGEVLAELERNESSYVDVAPGPGIYSYRLIAEIDECDPESWLPTGELEVTCDVVVLDVLCNDDSIEVGEALGAAVSEIEVFDPLIFTTVEVVVEVSHDRIGDLEIELESPQGATITLFSGDEENDVLVDVIFSDDGEAYGDEGFDCTCFTQPFDGVLDDLAVAGTVGVWTLSVTDTVVGSDGELLGWCLDLEGSCVLDAPSGINCVAGEEGSVDVMWANEDSAYSDLTVVRDGEVIGELDGDETSINDDAVGSGFNIYRVTAETEGQCTASSEPCIFEGVDVVCNEVDQDFGSEGASSDIEVADSIVLTDVEVLVEITHSWVGELEVDLSSPEGTVVRLHDGGGGLSDDIRTVFSDDGLPNDGATAMNCYCRMQPPKDSLSMLVDAEEGTVGDWSLEITDTVPVIRDGTLDRWCLHLVGEPALPSFLRGDSDGNGNVFAIIDALHILEYGFNGGSTPGCLDAADVDGDGTVFPIINALFLLEYGFSNGPAPPDPGPTDCGPDPDPNSNSVTCETASAGCS